MLALVCPQYWAIETVIAIVCECGFVCTFLYEYADRIWFLMGISVIFFIPANWCYTKIPVLSSLILVGILALASMEQKMLHLQYYNLLLQKAFFHIHIDSLGWKRCNENIKGNAILQINYLPNLKWT